MSTGTTIIGRSTTYDGDEHMFLRGSEVRIIGVMRGAARIDFDADDDAATYIRDDAALALAGGVTADDRVEVVPWIAEEARWGWATSDARAVDLLCFRSVLGGGHLN